MAIEPASHRAAEASFAAALDDLQIGAVRAGEVACAFVVEHLAARAGRRLIQARRSPALPCDAAHPAARLVAERHLLRLPELAARALVGWAAGQRDAELLRCVPTPRRVLELQARGRRCVSLLDDAPGRDPLDFALHDLTHLEKFSEPAHRAGQIGFFAATARAIAHPRWADLERGLDARWSTERDHVLADMNGSAAFLFVALKSRAKLAVARRVSGSAAGGDAWSDALEALLDAYALNGEARDAARRFGSRNDEALLGERLLHAFGG